MEKPEPTPAPQGCSVAPTPLALPPPPVATGWLVALASVTRLPTQCQEKGHP